MKYTIDVSTLNIKKTRQKYYQKQGIVSYSIYISNHPYRSIVAAHPQNQVLAFSPTKSIPFLEFRKTNPYLHDDIIVNEWIEGIMINLFYDTRIQRWEISTKGSVDGNYRYSPSQTITTISGNTPLSGHLYQRRFESAPHRGAPYKSVTGNLVEDSSAVRIEFFNGVNSPQTNKTYREMFLEAFCEDKTELNNLTILSNFSKQYSYSFVLQHPDNHITLNISNPRLYLVSVFEIKNNTVSYIYPNDYENWGTFSNLQGIIHFPNRYFFYSYNDIVEETGLVKNNINSMGIMLMNGLTGERTTLKNKAYEKLQLSLTHTPIGQYQYLCLEKINKVKDFLMNYPSYFGTFNLFEQETDHFVTQLHNSYYLFYVKKTVKQPSEISDKYLPHIYRLHHEVYLPSLSSCKTGGGEKKIINKKTIREYLQRLEPHQLLYYLNYERREHAFHY